MPFGYVPRARGFWRSAYAMSQRVIGAPNFLRRLQWPAVFELLEPKHGDVVLDLGCGDLQLTAELAKGDVATVIAADSSSLLAGRAYLVGQFPRLRLLRADGRRLPLGDASVDCVLASSVLQMVPDPSVMLDECRRVLKSEGRLVLTVPEAYRYLPKLFPADASFALRFVRWLLGLPREYATVLRELNLTFRVRGAGYVSAAEVTRLVEGAGLQVVAQRRVPGPVGTLIWEACLAVTYRFRDSRVPMLLAFVFYPLATVDRLRKDGANGCELVVAVRPVVVHG